MPIGLGGEQLWLCPTLDNATPFNDLSSQGNNGTAQGGLSTVADTGSGGAYCYDFDGIDDYIDCGAIGVSSGLSISAWVKRDEVANFVGIVTRYDEAAATDSCYYLMSSASGDGIRLYASQGSGVLKVEDYAGSVGDASWSHVAMRVGLGTDRGEIFVDGLKVVSVQVDNDNMSSFLNTAGMDTLIGARRNSTGASKYFNGLVDDVRIYNRVLTQSEITHLATARGIEGRPFDGLGDEKLWLCPSLENSPNDLSGNNNNGVYQGGMGTVADTAKGGVRAYDTSSAGDLVKCVYQGTDSISGWFYISSANRGASTSMFTGTDVYSGADWGDGLYWDNTTIYVKKNNTIGGWVNLPSGSVPVGAWFHYASVRTASGMSYYIDGVEVQTANTSTTDRGDFFIGNATGTTPIGDFRSDDIRAYTRALTQSEISWLATERGVLGTPPEGLGDEQLWLCPSLSDSPSDLSSNSASISYFNGLATTADTTSGGTRAYDFDAGNVGVDCGDILDSTVWATGNPFTISGWAKVGSDGVVVLSKLADTVNMTPTGSNNREWIVQVRDRGSGMKAEVTYYPVAQNRFRLFDTNSTLSVGTWYHFAFIYNGPTATNADPEIYIDGVSQALTLSATSGADDGAMADLNASVASGLMLEGANYGLPRGGRTDDIRAYNRVLTQSEITHLATSRGVLGSPTATTQYNAFFTHAFRQLFQTRLR